VLKQASEVPKLTVKTGEWGTETNCWNRRVRYRN
jgi:hypothetical protein